jgi:hypothetical protein
MLVLTLIVLDGYLKIVLLKIKVLLITNLNSTDIETVLIINHINSLAF